MAPSFEAGSDISIEMQLWQDATPIQKARFDLAPKKLVEQFKELSKTSLNTEWNSQLEKSEAKNRKVLETLSIALNSASRASAEKQSIETEINQNFADMIIERKLRCFAFEPPRKLNSQPIEMQAEHWTAYPIWETGEFKANGLHLIELRVMRAEEMPERIEAPQQVKLGRPTIKNHVAATFEALLAEGRINIEISAKSHFPLIRNWIAENDSSGNLNAPHIGDEGIRGHFSPLFKELKKNRKQ